MTEKHTQDELHLIHEVITHADELARLDHCAGNISNIIDSWSVTRIRLNELFPEMSEEDMEQARLAFTKRYNTTFAHHRNGTIF